MLLMLPLHDFAQSAELVPSIKKPLPWEILARAQTLATQKQYDQAAAAYEEYLAVRPANHKARIALGRIKLVQKRFGEAQKAFEQVLSKDPINRDARRGLADALYLNGQAALALPIYEALYAETKDPELADQIAKVTAGMEQPAAASEEPTNIPPPPTSPEGLLAQARELEAAKQYRDAAQVYREYLKARPDDVEVQHALARVVALQGYLDEAAGVYQGILAKHPSDLPALLAMAKILTWQKKAGAAKSYYERVLAVDPNNLEAKRGMADILYWIGEVKQSLRYYEDVYAATQIPEVGQRIQEIRGERLATPRAPIGRVQPETMLPFRDYAKTGAGYYAYTNGIKPEKTGTFMEGGKSIGDYTVIGKLELINRFGLEDLPVSAQFYGPLWHKAWGHATMAFAGSPTFVPNVDVEGEVFQGLEPLHKSLSFLEASIGWRHLFYMYQSPLFINNRQVPAQEADVFTPSLTAYFSRKVWLTEKVFWVPKTGSMTLSSRLTWRPTDRLELFASGAFGTTSERIIAVQDFFRADTQSYQAGVIFPISENFSGEMSGLYENRGFLYIRQGGNFYLIWHF